jgi:hypothetical protein
MKPCTLLKKRLKKIVRFGIKTSQKKPVLQNH